ncbi:MAG: single-stranded DNA-binding protein [Saprospiraceae bacterium]|nr:single-stranded DNA-binding protein [Saprospiraceae bacterium]
MKNLVNRVQLIGHLGKDAEAIDVGNGKRLAKVTLATNNTYYGKDGNKIENTDWHNLVAWGKTAELMTSLGTKGSKMAVSGKISTRHYEDKEGVKKYITEIIVDEFMMVGEKIQKPF